MNKKNLSSFYSYPNPAMDHLSPFFFPIQGKRKGRGGPWQDLNQGPWDLHVNPLLIILTWVSNCILSSQPFTHNTDFYPLISLGHRRVLHVVLIIIVSYWVNLIIMVLWLSGLITATIITIRTPEKWYSYKTTELLRFILLLQNHFFFRIINTRYT